METNLGRTLEKLINKNEEVRSVSPAIASPSPRLDCLVGLTDFLQRLTPALDTAVPDPTAREILIEFLASENANAECKKPIRSLRVRSMPPCEWTETTEDIDSNSHNLAMVG